VDDSLCLRYFLQPDDTLHRRYEALRAYFVQRRPLQEIATQFGYTYDTLRQMIHEFRSQCRAGTPPFVCSPAVRTSGPNPGASPRDARSRRPAMPDSSSTPQCSIFSSGKDLTHQSGGVAPGAASRSGVVGEIC
jgi:hypothetical protein